MEHLLYPSLFNPYGVILWIHLSQRDFYWGASDKLDALIDSFSIPTLVIKHNHGITKGSKTRICEMGNTFLQILNFLRRYPFFGNFMLFISCPFFWHIWGTPKIINIITKCAHITHDLCKMSFFFERNVLASWSMEVATSTIYILKIALALYCSHFGEDTAA